MSEEKPNSLPSNKPVIAEVRTKRKFSIIWVVPLIAAAIGGWLAYKSISEKGPLISISFENAEGLEAGKTKIKYKDVVVGNVEKITLAEELNGVIVLVRMEKGSEPYLTVNSRFWVAKARISTSEVSNLGTLLSGAYIAMEPSREGKPAKKFTGLAKPPQIAADVPGQHFMLQTPALGSVNIGSAVYYRQIKVGQVVDYQFAENRAAVNIKVFIHDPHHDLVNSQTKFWNASGVDVKLDANGIKVDAQSLVSIMLGGIAFETPANLKSKATVAEDHIFNLYLNREIATQEIYAIKEHYLMYFDQSVRGLTPGAPVEFRGIPIGKVVDIKLILDADKNKARIPVLVTIEPERFELWLNGEKVEYSGEMRDLSEKEHGEVGKAMLKHGLRAQLNTGNLLTGQLYIQLDFFPEAKSAEITYEDGYAVFPTVPSPFGQIVEEVNSMLKKINALPLEELSDNLNETIVALKQTLQEYQGLAGDVDKQVLPKLNQTLEQLQQTMTGLEKTFGADSALNFKTQQTLDELTGAIRSIRAVSDQLDRNPRALIFGRGESKQ